jgi:hypothetical protein
MVTLLLNACGGPPAQEQAPLPPTAQTAPVIRESPVSINAEMVALVDHAGHELWNVEKIAPRTDADWANVEHHAIQLAAAGTLISAAGTGVNDRDWVQSPGWQKWSRALSDAGMAGRLAAQEKNFESLVAANGRLVDACEGCHKEFKPDLPSEGITHVHGH